MYSLCPSRSTITILIFYFLSSVYIFLFVSISFRLTHVRPVGLKNVGNTCYFNSMIQTYFNLPIVRDHVLSFSPPAPEQTPSAEQAQPQPQTQEQSQAQEQGQASAQPQEQGEGGQGKPQPPATIATSIECIYVFLSIHSLSFSRSLCM